MFALFISASLLVSTYAATECVGGAANQVAPALPGVPCQPGLIETDDGNCCRPEGVQTVGASPATTTRFPGATGITVRVATIGSGVTGGTGNCVDRLNPRTGVSDCPARASYCQNPVYNEVMTRECPRTCNRCSLIASTVPGGCVDRLNPKTGRSDCPAKAALCSDPVYYAVMTQECPRTCNRCNGASTTRSSIIVG